MKIKYIGLIVGAVLIMGCKCNSTATAKPVPVPDRMLVLETNTPRWGPVIYIVRDTHTGDEYMIANQTGIIKLTASGH